MHLNVERTFNKTLLYSGDAMKKFDYKRSFKMHIDIPVEWCSSVGRALVLGILTMSPPRAPGPGSGWETGPKMSSPSMTSPHPTPSLVCFFGLFGPEFRAKMTQIFEFFCLVP